MPNIISHGETLALTVRDRQLVRRWTPPNTLIAAESRPPPHWVATVTVTHHGHEWEASGASLDHAGLFRS
jgi:hypothetical protein